MPGSKRKISPIHSPRTSGHFARNSLSLAVAVMVSSDARGNKALANSNEFIRPTTTIKKDEIEKKRGLIVCF